MRAWVSVRLECYIFGEEEKSSEVLLLKEIVVIPDFTLIDMQNDSRKILWCIY